MEYGSGNSGGGGDYDGGFAKFGNDTQQIHIQKQKKRNGNYTLYIVDYR